MLLNQFQEFVKQNQLFNASDKLLLAVSGGVDSMVLFHLCLKAGYEFSVAHVNFKLRGENADADEALVINTCKAFKIDCFTTNFNTQNYANEKKLSIQMAARELRYNYFDQLIQQHQFTKLLTAHHANDQIETFFINLLRSSGIKGLKGIPMQNENIIRPLLFATKNQIETYANTHQIIFHTDSSNLKDDYLRNHLRHHVIPAFNNASPNATIQILNSIQHLNDDFNLLQELHQKAFKNLITTHAHGIIINKTKLQVYANAQAMLFAYVKNYGFNKSQVQQMLQHKQDESGKLYYSNTHKILNNRNEFIISLIEKPNTLEEIIIHNIGQTITTPLHIKMQLSSVNEVNYKNAHANEAYFDASKIKFPLKLRLWQAGDQMQPLGMKNKKNLSDILIDNKVDILTKTNTYVLCNNNNQIIWLIGHRLSEQFKIDPKTKNVLYFTLK
jgi:tRNA(Ile)-lysidine synthase